jgi:hypothetical protein
MFSRRSGLKMMLEYNYDGLDAVAEKQLINNGSPRSAYADLFLDPLYFPNNWGPSDAQIQFMPSLGGGGSFDPNMSTETGIGMEYWEIEALGRIPGILRIGLWTAGSDVNTDEPDTELEFEFSPSSGWLTGDLPIVSYGEEGGASRVTVVAFRWFPAHLRTKAV